MLRLIRLRRQWRSPWLIGSVVGMLWIGVALACPMMLVVFGERGLVTGAWQVLRDVGGEPAMASALLAAIASALAVALALPAAIMIACSSDIWRKRLAVLLLAPMFINTLLRVYSLRSLASGNGLLARGVSAIGYSGPLIGSNPLVVAGLVYLYLPFAIIPLTLAVLRVDPNRISAALVLGLRGPRLTWAVARGELGKGLIAAWILTFVPAFGDYLAPGALGGAKKLLFATVVYNRAIIEGDVQFATLAVLLTWIPTLIVAFLAIRLERQG